MNSSEEWQWDLVRELAHMWQLNPGPVVEAALDRDVQPRQVIEGYTRTLRFVRLNGTEAASAAPLLELDARPPGILDARVVLQDDVWIDIFRRPHRVCRMSSEYARAVIALLQTRAPELFVLAEPNGDLNEWLETTPLMAALRDRLGHEPRGPVGSAKTDPLEVREGISLLDLSEGSSQ
ncbi:hypothetical protein ACFVWR_06955 [Leifsonia sp. NPDC058292]|uniref:hypothetical protein n=1 Tax=Leifsonia sp. NPDC058292 TaxID=3346428 RepID=UPI0036DCE701